MKFKHRSTFCYSTILALVCGSAHAGTVMFDDLTGASGPGLGSVSFTNINTPAPGQEFDQLGVVSLNTISINQKAFDNVDFIDLVYTVDSSSAPPGSTTEYTVIEGVFNGTGVDWTDYHIELGFGTGAGFVPSTAADGLDFDAPDVDGLFSFLPFTTVNIASEEIDALDGVFPDSTFINFAFTLDVPCDIGSFTIRQYPTIAPIPEPNCASLALLAGLGLCVIRRGK